MTTQTMNKSLCKETKKERGEKGMYVLTKAHSYTETQNEHRW